MIPSVFTTKVFSSHIWRFIKWILAYLKIMKTVFDNITINSTLQSHVFSQYLFVTLQNKDYSSFWYRNVEYWIRPFQMPNYFRIMQTKVSNYETLKNALADFVFFIIGIRYIYYVDLSQLLWFCRFLFLVVSCF